MKNIMLNYIFKHLINVSVRITSNYPSSIICIAFTDLDSILIKVWFREVLYEINTTKIIIIEDKTSKLFESCSRSRFVEVDIVFDIVLVRFIDSDFLEYVLIFRFI